MIMRGRAKHLAAADVHLSVERCLGVPSLQAAALLYGSYPGLDWWRCGPALLLQTTLQGKWHRFKSWPKCHSVMLVFLPQLVHPPMLIVASVTSLMGTTVPSFLLAPSYQRLSAKKKKPKKTYNHCFSVLCNHPTVPGQRGTTFCGTIFPFSLCTGPIPSPPESYKCYGHCFRILCNSCTVPGQRATKFTGNISPFSVNRP